MIAITYTIRNPQTGRLVACVERDLADLLWATLRTKGVGAFKTEAQVERALREAVAEVFASLSEGR